MISLYFVIHLLLNKITPDPRMRAQTTFHHPHHCPSVIISHLDYGDDFLTCHLVGLVPYNISSWHSSQWLCPKITSLPSLLATLQSLPIASLQAELKGLPWFTGPCGQAPAPLLSYCLSITFHSVPATQASSLFLGHATLQ